MKSAAWFGSLVLGLIIALQARAADEAKAEIKTGGNFEVEIIKDLSYFEGKDADPEKHKLDLYLPKGKKDFPVLIFVHGGSWKSGDKKLYFKLGEVFAKNGVGTVVTSYRLTPKVQHPGHIEDVARAFAWTFRNIAMYGGRTDQIFVSGHSAGGHLVALLATDDSYLKAEKLSPDNIKGVLPLSGVYTILPGRLSGAFGSDAEICRKASPINHVNGKLPPFLIVYAEKDYFTLDIMAESMCKKLKEAKVDADLLKMKDRDHITIIRNVANEDDPTTQAILGFIAKHSDLKLQPKETKPQE